VAQHHSREPQGKVVLLVRPPLGLFAAAAYFSLWGLSVAVLSVFVLVDVVAYPRELSPEGLATAFAGVPVFQALAILMLSAAYAVAGARPWSRWLAQGAALSGMIVMVSILILGAQSTVEVIGVGLNTLLLGTVSWYLERPSIRQFLASSISKLPDRSTRIV
jgi:hypothetical protein